MKKFITSLLLITTLLGLPAHGGVFSNSFDFQKEKSKSITLLISEIDSSGRQYSKEVFSAFGMATHLTTLTGAEYKKFVATNQRFYDHYRDLSQAELDSVARGTIVLMKYYVRSSEKLAAWFEQARRDGKFPKKLDHEQDLLAAHKFLSSFKDFQSQHDMLTKTNEAVNKLGGKTIDDGLMKMMSGLASAVSKKQNETLWIELEELIQEFCD